MADITIGHRTGHTAPATMDHPGQWHLVATRLMAHMGAYSPDEMNGLDWQWHQRVALRICATMQEHNIWDIPGSACYQGHASGHRRPRSQDVPEPPRHAACCDSPERQRGATTRGGFPLWHIQKSPATVRPAEGHEQLSHLRGARRHAGTTPRDKEPWTILSPQPHAASRGAASRLP